MFRQSFVTNNIYPNRSTEINVLINTSWHRFIYILLVHLLAYHHYMCGCLLIRISFLVLKLSVFQQKILLFLGNSPLYYGSNNFTCTFILMLKMKQKHIILSYKAICAYEVTCSFYLPPDSSCIIIYPFYRSLILFL
jgi:hypothetical protein